MIQDCEICGKKSKLFLVKVEKSQLYVCCDCKKYGTELKPPISKQEMLKRLQKVHKPTYEIPEPEYELMENYQQIIKNKREEKNLSFKELGKLINVRESILAKIESGKIKSDKDAIKKLEKYFHIKLMIKK